MLTRIFGRKKYGKTAFCIDKIRQCVQSQKRCFLIVPEQFTFSCEKKITDEIGNHANMYTEVLSFTRLCHRVFREFGGVSNSYLDSVGKVLCMTKVLNNFSDMLCEYGKSSGDIGFASSAVHTVEEFSSYNITSSDIENAIPLLEEKNRTLCAKLKDISLLSSAYKAELKSIYGTDGESLDMLCEVLSKNNFFGGSCVVIDSFYGYTPQELKIIRMILRQCEDVFITFACAKDDHDSVFARPIDAASSVSRIAADNNVEVLDICLDAPSRNDDISYLERNFAAYTHIMEHDGKRACGGDIHIIKCRNATEEAKAVTSVIYSLISEKNARFRDIAICARSINSYEGIIDTFLDKVNIPYTFSAREDLLTKPLISYISTALDFVTTWKQRSFLCLIKTGMVSPSAEDCSLLENYIRTWNINGKRGFLSDWYMNPEGYVEGFSERDSGILETVNATKEKIISSLEKFHEDISSAKLCRDISAAIYRLMLDSSYRDKHNSCDDIRFWNLTIKALDEIVRVYGDENVSVKQFSDIFATVINEYGVSDIPEHIDSVLIGSADLIRSETVKYMFVLGCNNEYFPLQKAEDEVFSDKEKSILKEHGIIMSASAKDCAYDEFFLAYNIFCDPYEKLFLLYSGCDLDGKSLRRSVLLDIVSCLFESDLEVSYPFDDVISNITAKNALADDMYSFGNASFVAASKEALKKDAEYSAVFDSAEGILNPLGIISPENSKKLFGGTVCSSPSRFESYSRCRFQYFNRYILKLRTETKAELDSINTGLVSHKLLELFVKELADSKLRGELFSHDEAKKRVSELLDTHFTDITHADPANSDSVSKRFRYLYNRLNSILCTLAVHLVDELSQSDFLPVDFEVNIGLSDDTIKTVPIDICDTNGNKVGVLKIVGQVDRADIYKKDGKTYVRIIDYKTGHKTFRKQEVDYGFNLQMLLYLYCIALSETKRYGDEVVPAGVLYIPVRRPEKSDAQLSDSTSEICSSALSKAFKGDGLLIDDIDILNAMDKGITGKFIPAVMGKNKMDSRSKIESLENMGALLKKAAEVSGKLASLMYAGNIQTNPYKVAISSCEHCDYKAVCRIDRKNDNIRYSFEEV